MINLKPEWGRMSGYHECVFICQEGITENAKTAPPGHGEVTEEVQKCHHQGPEGGMEHRGQ